MHKLALGREKKGGKKIWGALQIKALLGGLVGGEWGGSAQPKRKEP